MVDTITVDEGLATLREVVVEWGSQGPHTTGAIYDRLEAEYPHLVDAFVQTQRRELMCQAIRMMLGANRRGAIRRSVFSKTIEARAAGVDLFATEYPVNDMEERKPLRIMTKREVLYAAEHYERREQDNALRKALLRQIARKMKTSQKVEDAYTEEEITRVFRSVFGDDLRAVA